MVLTCIDDEQLDEVLEGWKRLLAEAYNFANDDDVEFDQEEFRTTMYETWELFSRKIDFNAPDEKYSLPIDLAVALGLMMIYGNEKQVLLRQDNGNIELSAMIADHFCKMIHFKEEYPRDKAVLEFEDLICNKCYRLAYNMETGELRVDDNPDMPALNVDIETGKVIETEKNAMEPLVVTDISRWWFDE